MTWPAEVDTDGAFADLVLLLHGNTLRDCRWGRKATSTRTQFRTVVHESSHALFNIPDEYCCGGGYWEAPPVLYLRQDDCNADAANLAWRNCSSFTADDNNNTWWRSEDNIIDIMNPDNPLGRSYVVEAGPADWEIMSGVLSALGPTNRPSVFAPDSWDNPASFENAVRQTRERTAERPRPTGQVAVLHLILDSDGGNLRAARVARVEIVSANPPKVFERSRGTWEVRLQGGGQPISYLIPNPLENIEIENPPDSPSPFSKVVPTGPVPSTLIVPLTRHGRLLGVERIQVVDIVTGRVVVDIPVRR